MKYKILVPTGIGDFSWIWSKLSTTGDSYIVEYPKDKPARLAPFLALLPKEKIISYAINPDVGFYFDRGELKGHFCNAPAAPIERYADMREGVTNVIEANTHLERGNRIETWLPDIPAVDFHYKIEGLIDKARPQDIFIVHLSSRIVKNSWNYYEIETWIPMIEMVQKFTGWTPVFIGGSYDDFAQECFEKYIEQHQAVSLIGRTPDLLSALCLVQQSKFFMGCVSSGLTMLANVLRVPSASWWPRPGLPPSWSDLSTPYFWFLWKNPEDDMTLIEDFIRKGVKR